MNENFIELIQEINKNIININTTLSNIENRITSLENKDIFKNSYKLLDNNNANNSFQKIEDKIDYLNKNYNNVINKDIISYLNEMLLNENYIENIKNDIILILRKNTCIYDVIAKNISIFVEDNNHSFKWIFVFPFQKNILYFWNNNKQSWDKMNKQTLLDLFNLFQKHILRLFSIMNSEEDDRLRDIDIIECGENLYVNNFDSKYNDFRKKIFNLLQNS